MHISYYYFLSYSFPSRLPKALAHFTGSVLSSEVELKGRREQKKRLRNSALQNGEKHGLTGASLAHREHPRRWKSRKRTKKKTVKH